MSTGTGNTQSSLLFPCRCLSPLHCLYSGTVGLLFIVFTQVQWVSSSLSLLRYSGSPLHCLHSGTVGLHLIVFPQLGTVGLLFIVFTQVQWVSSMSLLRYSWLPLHCRYSGTVGLFNVFTQVQWVSPSLSLLRYSRSPFHCLYSGTVGHLFIVFTQVQLDPLVTKQLELSKLFLLNNFELKLCVTLY